jgi:hypothetical protein
MREGKNDIQPLFKKKHVKELALILFLITIGEEKKNSF